MMAKRYGLIRLEQEIKEYLDQIKREKKYRNYSELLINLIFDNKHLKMKENNKFW